MALRLVPAGGFDLGPEASWDDPRQRVLGRASSCDLVIAARGVSKRHCAIEHRREGWFITDLGSSNGTLVNQRRISGARRLEDQDELTLGVYVLRVEISETGMFTEPVRFVVRRGGQERTVIGSRLLIGRKADCQLVVDESGVSRRQAAIEHDGQGFVLRDLDSKNGTFVAGRRIVVHRLAPGDSIHFVSAAPHSGRTRIEVDPSETACGLRIESPFASTANRLGGMLDDPLVTRFEPAPGMEEVEDVEDVAAAPATASMDAPPSASASASVSRRSAPAEVSPVSAAAAREEVIAESEELSRVIQGLERQKAKYRGGTWVPTSDLLPNRLRRWGTVGAFVLVLGAGIALYATGQTAALNPGPLASVHRGELFLARQAERKDACRPCHQPFSGVTNQACMSCHPSIRIPPPHDPPGWVAAGRTPLRCTECHEEHAGDRVPPRQARSAPASQLAAVPHPPPALPVGSDACLRCHASAHNRPPAVRDTAGQTFLNVFYSSTWVHTLHLSRPPCASCHATAVDQEQGRVTSACGSCHGAAQGGFSNSACLTCHYLHRPGPLLPAILPERRAPGAPKA